MTSINDIIDIEPVSFYPNPATDLITVNVKSEAEFQMLDMLGRIVLSGNLNISGVVDISGLDEGNYILKIFEQDSGVWKSSILLKN